MKKEKYYLVRIKADEESMCNIERVIDAESFDYKILWKINLVQEDE